jgi:hypothetical protein
MMTMLTTVNPVNKCMYVYRMQQQWAGCDEMQKREKIRGSEKQNG